MNIYTQINLSSDRWIELLDCYLNDKQAPEQGLGRVVIKEDEKFVQVENSLFDRQMVIEITKEKATHDFSSEHLDKAISIFKTFLIKQNEILDKTVTPLLNRFSTRFSKWAASHQILTCIVSILSFGILYKIWCTGHLTLQKEKKIKENIGSFQTSLTIMEGLLEASKTSQQARLIEDLEKEITPEDIASEILTKIRTLEKEILEYLDPKEFQEEIEEIQNLPKQSIYTHPTTINIDFLEREYLKNIVNILYLKEPMAPKKFLILKNNFFELLTVKALDLCYLSSSLTSDEDACLAIIKNYAKGVPNMANSLKTSRNFFLKAAKVNGNIILSILPEKYKDDREIVLECTAQCPSALYHSSQFRNDYTFALQAVGKNGCAFKYIDPQFQKYPEIILAAAPSYAKALQNAPDSLKKDKNYIESLLEVNGDILEYVSPEKRNDYATVLKAVKKSGCALQYASETLKGNKTIVRAAIKQNREAITFASLELQKDEELALICIKQNSSNSINCYLKAHWKSNKKISLEAIKYMAIEFSELSQELQSDREIVLAYLNQQKNRHFFNNFFSNDEEVMLVAIKDNFLNFSRSSENLKNDPKFILKALSQSNRNCRTLFKLLPMNLQENPEIALAFLKKDGLVLSLLPKKFQEDKKFALEAVKQNDSAYSNVPNELKNDPEILAAIA